MEDRDKIKEKLRKIKALAERGIGGEKEGALKLYNELLAKYELTDDFVYLDEIKRYWIRFDSDIDKKLIAQLFYKVTGDPTYYIKTDKRRHLIGFDCTDFEINEFRFYYRFYKEHLENELSIFMGAFFSKNSLFPDSTARVQYESEDKEESLEEQMAWLDRMEKMRRMADGIDRKTPNLQIEEMDKE